MTMLNGLGLCLITLRTKSSVALIPTSLLLAGSVLFPGIIWYETYTKDKQFHHLIKFGGAAMIFGWFSMAIL